MRVIVTDTSCLIDLRKASLLESFMRLPHEIIMPDILFQEELLKFTHAEKATLLEGGLVVVELPGGDVLRAQEIAYRFPALSIQDCYVFTLAERSTGCILLTGDNRLKNIAASHEIEVHGILWAVDVMQRSETATVLELIAALELFDNDETIRLPSQEVQGIAKRFRNLL